MARGDTSPGFFFGITSNSYVYMYIELEILKKNIKSKINIPNPIVPLGPPDGVLPDDMLSGIQRHTKINLESSTAVVWDMEERKNVLQAVLSELRKVYYLSVDIESDETTTGYILLDLLSQERLGIIEMMFGNVFVMIFDSERFRLTYET